MTVPGAKSHMSAHCLALQLGIAVCWGRDRIWHLISGGLIHHVCFVNCVGRQKYAHFVKSIFHTRTLFYKRQAIRDSLFWPYGKFGENIR